MPSMSAINGGLIAERQAPILTTGGERSNDWNARGGVAVARGLVRGRFETQRGATSIGSRDISTGSHLLETHCVSNFIVQQQHNRTV